MKLSILIPTLPKRAHMLAELMASLQKQISHEGAEVEILTDSRTGISIGEKRNHLLQSATGEYVCFFDDDDVASDYYIYCVMGALQSNPDCCSLNGVITTDGRNPKRFIHSIKYNSYFESDGVYYRPPNHLNVIRASIAKQFEFNNSSFGEDTDWAMRICRAGVLKAEAEIDDTLYFYRYISNK